ncbi:MAG: helix-turn-helix transcriptional regulator [Ruminococcaceae bacterium]|nr:helix-turn-helix transcriptional regulator [Oscillospiraceae bacterium]
MKQQDSRFPFEMYSISGNETLVQARYSETKMEIVEVTAGNVKIQIGTETIDASVGDFLYIPHGLVYRADASEGYASVRGMIFDTSIIEANMVNYETEILYMFYVQSENKIKIFKEGHPIHDILSRCMSESYEEYLAKDVCYKLPIRANIYLSMTALLRHYCTVKDDSERMIYHNVLRLRPVINYIAEHYAEKIYVENLADIIMVSPDYFTKMFKDSIGKTPVDYINGIRVNRSMQLLIDSDKSIAEIAEDIGFCNANYFHKIFKQYMEKSPLAYRKGVK